MSERKKIKEIKKSNEMKKIEEKNKSPKDTPFKRAIKNVVSVFAISGQNKDQEN